MARVAAAGDGAAVLLLQREHLRRAAGKEKPPRRGRRPEGPDRRTDQSAAAREEREVGCLEASIEQRGTVWGLGTSEVRRRTAGERELRQILYEERDCDGTVIK